MTIQATPDEIAALIERLQGRLVCNADPDLTITTKYDQDDPNVRKQINQAFEYHMARLRVQPVGGPDGT